MATILLINEDHVAGGTLSQLLESDGHKVRSFPDAEEALRALGWVKPDLALWVSGGTQGHGFPALRHLRESAEIPVVILSASATDDDEVTALRSGAEDFLHLPVGSRVLLERVRHVLRRCASADVAAADPDEVLVRGALEMDRGTHGVRWNGTSVSLTPTEFNVLWVIAKRPNMVFSRERVLDRAYGASIHVTDRTIDTQIKRIRTKMRKADPGFEAIETLYGLGYRFVVSAERQAA